MIRNDANDTDFAIRADDEAADADGSARSNDADEADDADDTDPWDVTVLPRRRFFALLRASSSRTQSHALTVDARDVRHRNRRLLLLRLPQRPGLDAPYR